MSGPIYRRAPGALFSEVGDDVVALHIDRGQCFGMEKVSAVIWKLLEEPRDLNMICVELINHYAVDPGECREQVGPFLDLLRTEGLIEIA